ncbi:MAG: hypothetical protein AAF682_21430 [Planctomycetota bacterium]
MRATLPKPVAHRPREPLPDRALVFVTLLLQTGLPPLRGRRARSALERAVAAGGRRTGFRLLRYSVRADGLRLLVRVDGNVALARAIQGVSIRIAKGLNRVWSRRGRVFAQRYEAEAVGRTEADRRTARGRWQAPRALTPP